MERWNGFRTILDLETSGLDDRVYPYQFNQNYYADFLAATRNNFRESPYFYSKVNPDLQKPYQLLGFHARGLIRNKYWEGFQSNDPIYLRPDLHAFASNHYARDRGALDRARRFGAPGLTEEDLGQAFYQGIERKIQTHGQVRLEGWHIASHLAEFESLTHRYDSLSKYQGFFARQHEAGVFEMRGVEEDLLKTVWQYGQQNPQYAEQNFRWAWDQQWRPQSWEDLRRVKFWSLDNVVDSLGGWQQFGGRDTPKGHTAAQEHLRSLFSRISSSLGSEEGVESLTEQWGTKFEGQAFFDNLFRKEKSFPALPQTQRWQEALSVEEGLFTRAREASMAERLAPWKRPALAVGLFGAAAVAMGLAYGKRRDRQTQIEGLQHDGLAGAFRKENTDFGSGWRGLDENTSTEHAGLLSLGLAGTYAAHKLALSRYPGYGARLYRFAKEVETRSPRNVLATLGLSQRASTYLPDQLAVKESDLFKVRGLALNGENLTQKTRLAEHLERLLPGLDLESYAGKTLEFQRLQSHSPYLTLKAGGEATPYHVSFQKAGVMTGVSERFGAPHGATERSSVKGLRWGATPEESLLFQPYLGKTDGQRLHRIWDQARRETFTMSDRMNRMLLEFHWPGHHHLHLGIEPGGFSSSTELLTKLLTRRALPVAAGVAGLAYADYLLGHRPSNALFTLAAQGRVAWAEATDRIPGARDTTDWYQQHVPGPQYGPLALPIAGAFAGGLAHYSRILAGEKMGDTARQLRAHRYAIAGAVAGSLLALPFVPGMLGSRKTADQLRSEYAGETPVPVRAGRWWQFGQTALSGGRIIAWKPSWYALHRSRVEDASLYGTEEEKWAHSPLLHPLRWFKNPNWLAERHSEDRPYPMTSPAFSNVPLLGPLLAASVGKVVAPPKRLHEQEWDASDYTLYTKAVEPKSPRALAPVHPHEEFDVHHLKHHAEEAFEEAIGLPGFLAKTVKGWFKSGDDPVPHVYFEGTRQMTSWARRYYERELGAIPGYSEETGIASYSEPIRRFLTHERDTPRVNELPNRFSNVSWLPGEEGIVNFKKGDPYCVHPETLIEVGSLGFFPAKHVYSGDFITSHKGILIPVKARRDRLMTQNEKAYQLKVNTLTGLNHIFSEKHPILILNNAHQRRNYSPTVRIKAYEHANAVLRLLITKGPQSKTEISESLQINLSYLSENTLPLLRLHDKVNEAIGQQKVTVNTDKLFDLDLLSRGLEWKPAKDVKKGDYVAYPYNKPSVNENLVLDLSPYADLSTEKWIYLSGIATEGYVKAYEWLEAHPLTGRIKRGARQAITSEIGCTDRQFESAQINVRRKKPPKRAKRFVELTKDAAYLFGLYLAEGSCDGNAIYLSLHVDEQPLFERACQGAKDIEGYPRQNSFARLGKTNGARGLISSTLVSRLVLGLFGKGCRDKTIPGWFENLPDNLLLSFAKGYIDGDGHAFQAGDQKFRLGVTSTNLPLLLQFRKLLLRFDVVLSVIKSKPQTSVYNGKEIRSGCSYRANLRGAQAVKLARLLSYRVPEKEYSFSAPWHFVSDGYVFLRVLSNDISDAPYVIGYEVDHDDSFCVAGFATHNTKITLGFARLPGSGYEALHPELKGVDPENYPDIVRLEILGDVAPFSLQFRQLSRRVGHAARRDKALEIKYQKILDRAEQTKASSVRFDRRHSGETEEVEGTIEGADASGVRLREYPGQSFSFSSLGLTAADLSSYSLGQTNWEMAADVTRREQDRSAYLEEKLAPGAAVRLTVPKGALSTTRSQAVITADGDNINRELVERGYATVNLKDAGPEAQAMDGAFGKLFRKYTEALSFEGDEAWYNPTRYLPASIQSKLWNERTALDQYLNQEVLGTKMRRWQRPIHDFLDPYLHSAAYRLTGRVVVPEETQEKRDLDTLTDQLSYLRELYGAANDPAHRVDHLREMRKTSIGANLFGETDTLPRTLSSTDRKYFSEFVRETNPDTRERIMASVSKEMADTLMAQWTRQSNAVKRARGRSVEDYEASGRVVTQLDIDKITDFDGKVVKVIDGDSLLVRTADGDKEVRLANINSREIPTKQGFTDKQMTAKLALGQHVRAHEIGRDKYERHVSDVFFDDKRLLNYELLNSGHAHKDVYDNQDGSNQEKLSVGDYFRAREIARFFHRRGLHLPGAESEVVAPDIDYEDVKVKIVQWEGQNAHDFGIFDDRASMMWRKPYLDGAVRELTAGDDRSVEETTRVVEQAIAASRKGGPKADVRAARQSSRQPLNTIEVTVKVDPEKEIRQDLRRNREEYVN